MDDGDSIIIGKSGAAEIGDQSSSSNSNSVRSTLWMIVILSKNQKQCRALNLS